MGKIIFGIKFLNYLIALLLVVAFFTLVERKIMAAMQRRIGPNIVGFWGLLQPLADGLKLFVKESIKPSSANTILFLISPIWVFVISLISWGPIMFSGLTSLSYINFGILYILAASSLGVYGIIIAGWSSNSKYAFLGSLRSAAQMISYEISLGVLILTVGLYTGSLNLGEIVYAQEEVWFIFPLLPCFIMFFVSGLAETNRPPFDLPEAEAELVSGFNIEYASMGFALFFLGETANILLMSTLITTMFLGGWLLPFGIGNKNIVFIALGFSIKVLTIACSFVWVRATLPRYRYDQLMYLGWKVFLPFSLAFFLAAVAVLMIV
jgi:NADH-quinone oxidoreductase subunit H